MAKLLKRKPGLTQKKQRAARSALSISKIQIPIPKYKLPNYKPGEMFKRPQKDRKHEVGRHKNKRIFEEL